MTNIYIGSMEILCFGKPNAPWGNGGYSTVYPTDEFNSYGLRLMMDYDQVLPEYENFNYQLKLFSQRTEAEFPREYSWMNKQINEYPFFLAELKVAYDGNKDLSKFGNTLNKYYMVGHHKIEKACERVTKFIPIADAVEYIFRLEGDAYKIVNKRIDSNQILISPVDLAWLYLRPFMEQYLNRATEERIYDF